MPRKAAVVPRGVNPDPLYESTVVMRMINVVMERGKKSLASRIVYGAIEKANGGRIDSDPLEVFTKAIENAKPKIEVKSRRVGGATYQVPMEVPPARQLAVALRWMVDGALNRKGIAMADALAAEIKDAAAGQGYAIRKRDDTHRMAQANRAFAHLRW